MGSILSAIIDEMPDYEVESVVRLGEGMENDAFEVNGGWRTRHSCSKSLPARSLSNTAMPLRRS